MKIEQREKDIYFLLQLDEKTRSRLREGYRFFSSWFNFQKKEEEGFYKYELKLPSEFEGPGYESFATILSLIEDPSNLVPHDSVWTSDYFRYHRRFLFGALDFFQPTEDSIFDRNGQIHNLTSEMTPWLKRKNLLVYCPSDFYFEDYLVTFPAYLEIYQKLKSFRKGETSFPIYQASEKNLSSSKDNFRFVQKPDSQNDRLINYFCWSKIPLLIRKLALIEGLVLMSKEISQGYNTRSLFGQFIISIYEKEFLPVVENIFEIFQGKKISDLLIFDDRLQFVYQDYFFILDRKIYQDREEILACVDLDIYACGLSYSAEWGGPNYFFNDRFLHALYFDKKNMLIPNHVHEEYEDRLRESIDRWPLIPGYLNYFNNYFQPGSKNNLASYYTLEIPRTENLIPSQVSSSLLIPYCKDNLDQLLNGPTMGQKKSQKKGIITYSLLGNGSLRDEDDEIISDDDDDLDDVPEEEQRPSKKPRLEDLIKPSLNLEPDCISSSPEKKFHEPGEVLTSGTSFSSGTILPKGFIIPSQSILDCDHPIEDKIVLTQPQEVPPGGLILSDISIVPKPGIMTNSFSENSNEVTPNTKLTYRYQKDYSSQATQIKEWMTEYGGIVMNLLSDLNYLDRWPSFDRKNGITGPFSPRKGINYLAV